MRQLVATALVLSLALAGCVPQSSTGGANAPSDATSGPVGPGSAPADSLSASLIFDQVCVESAPSFRSATAALSKLPFRQHPSTGTYYHQNLDLSVKLMPHRCSMVFSSQDDATQIGIEIAATAGTASAGNSLGIDPLSGAVRSKGPKGTQLEFDPAGTSNGRHMYRAVLITP